MPFLRVSLKGAKGVGGVVKSGGGGGGGGVVKSGNLL